MMHLTLQKEKEKEREKEKAAAAASASAAAEAATLAAAKASGAADLAQASSSYSAAASLAGTSFGERGNGMESGFTAVPGLGSSLGTVREEKSATSPAGDAGGDGQPEEMERGRSKGKSRVVGFSGSRPPSNRLGEDL